MQRNVLGLTLILAVVLCLGATGLYAQGWQWPEKMSIGGFNINDINGTVKSDGSGSATGTISLPGAYAQKISLTRSSRGDVTGSLSIDGKAAGVDMQGSFTLNNSGLTGRGAIKTSPKPVSDASISIDSRGQMSGSGRVSFGSLSIPVKFSANNGSLSLSGSASNKAQADTPLALYKFDGDMQLTVSQGRMELNASGKVQRTGKLANQVTNYTVSDVQVNLSNGQGTCDVGGVNITLRFF